MRPASEKASRWAFAAGLASATLLWASMAHARIVLVDGPRGPFYTNVPEPASATAARPSSLSLPFRSVMAEAGQRHGVDPALVEAVIACESNFNTQAKSAAGACGLMQLMPQTAARYGLEDPFEVDGNVDAGTRHLADLLRTFRGDWRLAVAAYNAGEGAVRRARGVPAFPETRRYVRKIESYLGLLGKDVGRGAVAEAAPEPARDPEPPPVPRPRPGQRLQLVRDAQGRLVVTNVPPPPSGSGQ